MRRFMEEKGMPDVDDMIAKVVETGEPSAESIVRLLDLEGDRDIRTLHEAAYGIKTGSVGNTSYFRGIIEFSNVCTKNCFYCGIRHDRKINRYTMSKEEILAAARFAHESRYGSIVLQSGERDDKGFVDFVDDLLREIKELSGGKLGITLSTGEQSEETYRRWFESGAHRYLLRIETSNRELYGKLHPADHSFDRRLECLMNLKSAGYQVGTGVMIGLPFQTTDDLAGDILFFKDMDVDMIGMGPYVSHGETPLAGKAVDTEEEKLRRLELALKMIAVTRIVLKDVNIASATALQSLDPRGRETGLQCGANVIMPNLTPAKYRGDYLLYENKPCVDEDSDRCSHCLERGVLSIGETIGWDEWGDSKHYFRRTGRLK